MSVTDVSRWCITLCALGIATTTAMGVPRQSGTQSSANYEGLRSAARAFVADRSLGSPELTTREILRLATSDTDIVVAARRVISALTARTSPSTLPIMRLSDEHTTASSEITPAFSHLRYIALASLSQQGTISRQSACGVRESQPADGLAASIVLSAPWLVREIEVLNCANAGLTDTAITMMLAPDESFMTSLTQLFNAAPPGVRVTVVRYLALHPSRWRSLGNVADGLVNDPAFRHVLTTTYLRRVVSLPTEERATIKGANAVSQLGLRTMWEQDDPDVQLLTAIWLANSGYFDAGFQIAQTLVEDPDRGQTARFLRIFCLAFIGNFELAAHYLALSHQDGLSADSITAILSDFSNVAGPAPTALLLTLSRIARQTRARLRDSDFDAERDMWVSALQQQPSTAIWLLKTHLGHQIADPGLGWLRGQVAYASGDIPAALVLWKEAASQRHALAGLHNDYAYVLAIRGGDLREAETHVLKALKLSPDTDSYVDTHAWVMHLDGRSAEAYDLLERICSDGCPDPEITEHFDVVIETLGLSGPDTETGH